MRKILTLLIISTISFHSFGQRNPSKVVKQIMEAEQKNEGSFRYEGYQKTFSSYSSSKVLKALKPFTYEVNKAVRNKSYSIIRELALYEKDIKIKQQAIEILTNNNYYVSGIGNWTDKLKAFEKNDFNKVAKNNIYRFLQKKYTAEEIAFYTKIKNEEFKNRYLEKLDKNKNDYEVQKAKIEEDAKRSSEQLKIYMFKGFPDEKLILFAGFLEIKECMPYLYYLKSNDSIKDKSYQWCVSIALARMGETNETNWCTETLKKMPLNDDIVYTLVPDLIYTRQQVAFSYLVELLNIDSPDCIGPNPELGNTKILCGFRIMEYLAPVIKDFPLKIGPGGDIETDNYKNALTLARTWFKENEKYIIDKSKY